MARARKVIIAVALAVFVVAAALWLVFLRRQGVDRADKWVTIVGFFVSTAVGLAGLAVAWPTWRQSGVPGTPPSSRAAVAAPGAVVVVGDNVAGVATDVAGVASVTAGGGTTGVAPVSGLHAAGPGSVVVGGDSRAPITTRFRGPGTAS
ncbi:hypothetical protein E1165_18110 [Micromonospora sp. KC723]|nr:hypothetical protein E1165_18110 [Micromonospora sp. KC723]